MIQRQQTLWLLLATFAAIGSFMFPFVVGDELKADIPMPVRATIDAGSSFLLLLATCASLVISAVTIFLYKNRPQQVWLCAGGMVITLLLIFLYVKEMNKLREPVLALSAVLPVLILFSYIMALRGIRKDDKLVKSLDKLR
jgi:uncharacterized protein YacL